ncbi:hypothetical protein A7A09_019115 [Paracoccus methylarcula]|uniref:HTH cro/C1-type domain-containing protein n=2 Tax=Paracoccus methylarcula TaxID=72022 RepID=A0A422QSH6_9RHOB|nr:hypothetical protein A7A09_019115 [Paracoccus methylarcula]
MEGRGWKKSDLAAQTGIPYQRLNPWFTRANAKPNAVDLVAVAGALGVPLRHIAHGEPLSAEEQREMIIRAYDQLPPDGRQQLADYAQFLSDRDSLKHEKEK